MASNKQNKKKAVKDLIIIALSIISLLLLVFIIVTSRKKERQVTDYLKTESETIENTGIISQKKLQDFVIISEVCADKWIELYNCGTEDIDLNGVEIYISGKLDTAISESLVVARDSYAVIDLKSNPGTSKNNVLVIRDTENSGEIAMIIPKLNKGQSYGRLSLDSYDMAYVSPSKGEATKSLDKYVTINGIGYSVPGGFYDGEVKLTLMARADEKIYYTTDGTKPTTQSEEYTGPISIKNMSGGKYVYAELGFGRFGSLDYLPKQVDKGMVVRAIRTDASGKVKGEATQEYFIGMAKDVSYQDMAVISLTSEPDGLFGYENGIYVSGKSREDALIQELDNSYGYANYFNNWKRDAKISYYEPEKGKTLELEGQINVFVNSDTANAQKSLEFRTTNSFDGFKGSSLLDYMDTEGHFVLNAFEGDNAIKVRELLSNELLKDSKVGTEKLLPCILFIDGEYWGMYHIKAPYDSRYIEEIYGVTSDVIIRDYDGAYNQDYIDFYKYVTENDMSVAEYYDNARKQMDMDSYLEFVCANMFFAKTSFRTTQATVWRTKNSEGTGYNDGRWRWLMEPAGSSMASKNTQTATIDSYLQESLKMDKFFQSLLRNKEFCSQLSATMRRVISEYFTQEKCDTCLDAVVELTEKPAKETYERYSKAMSAGDYEYRIEEIRSFFENRGEYIIKYTDEQAQKGGDLEYIKEQEALKKPTQDQSDIPSDEASTGLSEGN